MRRSVPVLLRSATLAARQRRSLPQTLIFFVTSRCNARCDFCLYKDSVQNPTRRREELTVEEVRRIAASYGPLHYLALSGGEPFVRRDLEALCQAFIDECGTSVIDIPSNFAYGDVMVDTITPLVARNPQVQVDLQLSLDQVGHAHDESRGVAGLFERAVAAAERLAAIRDLHPNLSLKVNIVWLERNREEIEAIVAEIARRVPFDRIHLSFPHEHLPAGGGGPELATEFDRFQRQAEQVARRARNRFDPYAVPIRAVKLSADRMIRRAITGETSMGTVCEAGRNLVVIDERGEVFPCEVIWRSVGNLRDHQYDVGAVLGGDAYEEFREEHLGPGRCNCTWSCAPLAAVSVTPSRYPRVAADAG